MARKEKSRKGRVGAPKKLTKAQVRKALEKTAGTITLAAEQLGVAYTTIRRYIDGDDELESLIEQYRERRVDKAELKLEQAIQKGEPWAVSLTLKTLGKNRGYVERQEVAGDITAPVLLSVNMVKPKDLPEDAD